VRTIRTIALISLGHCLCL